MNEFLININKTIFILFSRKKSNKWDNPIGKNLSPLDQAKNVALMIKRRLDENSKPNCESTPSEEAKQEANKVRSDVNLKCATMSQSGVMYRIGRRRRMQRIYWFLVACWREA